MFCVLFFVATIISGCDQTVKDFASGAIPSKDDGIPSNGVPTNSSLKVSPALINVTHPSGAIKGNISITNRTYLAGADMAVNLTINRTTGTQ